jgi:plastocyanin
MRSSAGRPACVAALAVIVCLLSAVPVPAASIKGAVIYAGPAPEKKMIPINIDQYVCGKSREAEELVLGANRGIRWAVVSLQSPPAGARWEPSSKPVQMDQQGCVYAPRVVIVPVGGTVEFLNSDPLLHNLHSVSTDNPVFNRTQPKGRTIPVVFRKAETVRVDCDLHTWMRAWVVATDHAYYAVTGPNGEFALDNVPPGKYTLKIWQEILGTVTSDVTVGDRDTTGLTVEMGKK